MESGMALSVGIAKKCGRTVCPCTDSTMPITEILYGKEHPKNFYAPNKGYTTPHTTPLHAFVPTATLKKLSRKFPRVYKLVKERQPAVVAGIADIKERA